MKLTTESSQNLLFEILIQIREKLDKAHSIRSNRSSDGLSTDKMLEMESSHSWYA